MIYFIIGLAVGIVGTYFLMRPKKQVKTSTPEAGEPSLTNELIEEKQKNLEKARAFIAKKAKENPGEIADASHGARITNDDLQKELGCSDATIVRYLNDLESEGLIKQVGKTGKYTYYEVV